MSEWDVALSAINMPTSTSPAPLPRSCMSFLVTSRNSCCRAICIGSIAASPSPPLPPRCSLGPPRLTLTQRPDVPGSTGVQYCTSQPALLRLPAHVRQIGQISCPKGVMNNSPRNPEQQALAVLAIHSSSSLTCSVYSRPPRRYIHPRCGGGCGQRLL